MFEEAYYSGILSLKERKLKEFPTNYFVKYDLTDLINCDLSQNYLTELPPCLCELEYLETLQLQCNNIHKLPTTIHLLKSLGYLDLSENHVDILPISLFYLRLKILLLNGNKIIEIPREIRNLENCLNELDLSYNLLKEIPSDISLLKSLKILNISNNKLINLPVEIGYMKLEKLNISNNLLTIIPYEFCNLSGYIIDFIVDNNPFIQPPSNIIEKGREHIFKWLSVNSPTDADGYKSYNEWAFSRCSNINATLRRPDRINDKNEKRGKSNRFNTLGGSDSGYTSTGDSENRLSHENGVSKGSLEEINEKCLSTPSTDRSCYLDGSSTSSGNSSEISGDLAKEVMLAYAETVIEKKMAARGSPSSPHYRNNHHERKKEDIISDVVETNNNEIKNDIVEIMKVDVSNNNIVEVNEENIIKVPLVEPETSRTENEINGNEKNGRVTVNINEKENPVVEMKPKIDNEAKKLKPNLTVKAIPKISTTKTTNSASSVSKPTLNNKKISPPSKVSTTTNSTMNKSTINTSTTKPLARPSTGSANAPRSLSTKPSTGLKKPLSTSKIAPAPSISSISTIGRRSDPSNKSSMASTRNLASSRSTLSSSTIETKNSTLKKPSAMSKSVTIASKKSPSTTSSSGNNNNTGTGPSVIDTMKRILESKIPGTKLPGDKDKISNELSSGTILCNFANKIKPRIVINIANKTPGEVTLSPIRSRKNAENFVNACKKLGVPDASLCTVSDIVDKNNLVQIAKSVLALNKLGVTNASTATVSSVAARV